MEFRWGSCEWREKLTKKERVLAGPHLLPDEEWQLPAVPPLRNLQGLSDAVPEEGQLLAACLCIYFLESPLSSGFSLVFHFPSRSSPLNVTLSPHFPSSLFFSFFRLNASLNARLFWIDWLISYSSKSFRFKTKTKRKRERVKHLTLRKRESRRKSDRPHVPRSLWTLTTIWFLCFQSTNWFLIRSPPS